MDRASSVHIYTWGGLFRVRFSRPLNTRYTHRCERKHHRIRHCLLMRHWTQNARMHKRESASKQHSQEIKIRSEVDHLFSLLTFEFVLKLPKLYGSASDAGAARGAIIQIRWNVLGTRACVIIVFAQNNTLPAACTVSNVHWILSYLNESFAN